MVLPTTAAAHSQSHSHHNIIPSAMAFHPIVLLAIAISLLDHASSLKINPFHKVSCQKKFKPLLPDPLIGAKILSTAGILGSAAFGAGYLNAARSAGKSLSALLPQLLPTAMLSHDLCFPDVYLPYEESDAKDLLAITGTSAADIVAFVSQNILTFTRIIGKPKDDFNVLKPLHDEYVNQVLESPLSPSNKLPKGYKYFGINDGVKNLEVFLKNNPFLASALTSYEDSNGDITFEVDPYGITKQTLFSDYVAALDDSAIRVIGKFDKDLKIISLDAYKGRDFSRAVKVNNLSESDKAYRLLNIIAYHAQNIHASTHIFHILLTTGIVTSTKVSSDIHEWAKPYIHNLYLKYVEVAAGLYSKDNGALTGFIFPADDYNYVIKTARAMLCEWGSLKTADEYVYNFLFKNVAKSHLESAGICEQYRKQTALIKDYASELDAEFAKYPEYSEINNNLKIYSEKTGPGVSSVSDIKTFIELISASGILHGSTLSLSRLLLTTPMLALIKPTEPTFGPLEAFQTSLVTGTILGICEGYEVFSSELPSKTPYNIYKILSKHEEKSRKLKYEYFEAISADEEHFNNFGWILTDHGPSQVDGKQLTLTTYI